MTNALRIRHLSFLGPSRTAATIEFGPGLNVIFGASNTGKSFIADTIDFMLGGRGPLRDIPERIGYNQILLALETTSGEAFTLYRSTEGGAFRVYEGLFTTTMPEGEGSILAEQHNDKRDDNLSAFLLAKLELGHRRIRRNKRGETQSLSFRNLARLAIVNEEEIIQQRSPLSDGNRVADTANTSVFKLLLTGVDDSALASTQDRSPEEQSKGAQLELLDQLIIEYRRKVKDLAGPPRELEEQLEKLDASMAAQTESLAASEADFREVSKRRRDLSKGIEDGQNRLAEITTLLERFTLLEAHYRSDVDRLRAIEEAGSLFGALGKTTCPLCGAMPEHQGATEDCAGNVDRVIAAARAEIAKIVLRQGELKETITDLRKEAVVFEKRLPTLEQRLGVVAQQIEQIVAPNLRRVRTNYKEFADKSGEVREALGLYRTLQDFEDRKSHLEGSDQAPEGGNDNDVDLPTSTVDKFAALVQEILVDWHFPDAERVHFDLKTRDLVIKGKSRTSYGKGLRAITQAAFTIGLMQYCRQNDISHPGFALLDSPLLSYREPENASDDLRGSDLNARFYGYLEKLPLDRQVIIIENTDPPDNLAASPKAIKFTGVASQGRAGYFPAE